MASLPTELTDRARALTPDFELQREIGRGGMGVVYLAVDVTLDRQVAIKVLPEGLAQSSDVRDRFLREARTAAKLSHPNIVPIYRADEMGGVVFFVMGYVDGPSLGERLAVTGTVPSLEGARLLRDVALALHYAHGRGVIHRDVKPENILVERTTERPLMTDFGIARLAEAAPLTQTGQVLGTVHYMSPEQVSGDPIDGRSDLYSLGVVGFRLVTGRLPFDAASASAVLVSHVTKAAPRVREIAPATPPLLAAVIERCLRKNPDERFASGAAMAAALDEAIRELEREPVADGSTGPAPPVLSAREAEAVWARAAELQSETSVHSQIPRPLATPEPGSTDPRDRRTLTTGYSFTDVRAAAAEAGIATKHVARAAQELGLVPGASSSTGPVGVVQNRSAAVSPWLGSSADISIEVQVSGEAGSDEFELLLDMIQRHLRDAGHVSTLKRSLRWSSSVDKRQLQVSVSARGGQTTIRADERLKPLIGGIFGGIVGGVGGGSSGLAMPLGATMFGSAVAGFGLWAVGIGGSYLLARTVYRRAREKRERELRELVEELAAALSGATPLPGIDRH